MIVIMKLPIHNQAGVSLLEFSISAALFFMLLLGAVVWGLNIWEMNTLQYAVERGARCAILPVASNGSKLCGSTTEFAAKSALGLSSPDGKTGLVTDQNFTSPDTSLSTGNTIGSEPYSFYPNSSAGTPTGNSTTFYASCVTTQSVGLFSSAMPLISAAGTAGTVRYCRPGND